MADKLTPGDPTPMPIPRTSFIGREAEVATVLDLLGVPTIRLLTLIGPGGIGKTRLALHVAELFRAHAGVEVVVVSLTPIRDPDLVTGTIAQALGVPDAPGQSTPIQLQTYLQDKHLLLVLDNLEHILNTAADLVAGLLSHCPHLTVLGTSRTRLGISGEQVLPLGTLTSDAARTLFENRARSHAQPFTLTADLVPTIDAICDRLDRLPLAIELAAARIPVLPPPALMARLDRALNLLTTGPRDAPSRHRDMRGTIAWSFDLLDHGDQVLFRRLGVFVGGFTLDAARAVGGDDTDPFDGVSRLVNASLVNPIAGEDNEPRFTMLETIREFALEQLTASRDELDVRKRHAHSVVCLGETLWELPEGPHAEAWTRKLRAEIGNIRLALEWALAHEPNTALQLAGALGDYWVHYGSHTEGRAWVERTLQAAPHAPSRYRARALSAIGWLAMDHHDLTYADMCLTEAVALARTIADPKLLLATVLIAGQVALKGGDLDRAQQRFLEVRRLAVDREPLPRAIAAASLGQVTMALGNVTAAQELFEEALATHESGSGPIGVAFGHLYVGQVSLARGDYARAAVAFREALVRFAAAWGPGGAARALEGLSGVVVTSKPEGAARLLGAAAVMRDGDEWPRDQIEVPAYEQAMAMARTALGELAFARAWEAGTRLTEDELMAEVDVLIDAIIATPAALSPSATWHGLTPRELEVLRLLVEGLSNRVIGETLSVSERTIETHVGHILHKMDLESRTAAVTYAIRHGFV